MIYTFPTYYPVLAALVTVLSGALGIIFIRRGLSRTAAYCAIVLALFLGVLITPSLVMDTVVLNDEKLEQTTGFWLSPTVKGFSLSELESVVITIKKDRKGRKYESWTAKYLHGEYHEVNPGDLWEINSHDIADRLRTMGIRVTRQ